MLIDTYYNGVEIHRENKIIYAKFLVPHQVLSTCRSAGGLRTDLEYLLNHQSCEPAGHCHRLPPKVWRDPIKYGKTICAPWGLPPEKCAVLETAANMNNAAFQRETFRGLEVVAICTGGVETNAGRVGDPASVYETPEGFEKIGSENNGAISMAENEKSPGTINIMLFINKPLTPGALTRTIVTATEAKTTALQELAVNSRYSDGLATGTGTDQTGIAAVINDDPPLTGAGKHVSLGELIGRAVLKAVKKTLKRQNTLIPSRQCSAKIHIERFGITRADMKERICQYLDMEEAELLRKNFMGIERDPLTVAAAAAMAHLKDKFAWGILPITCWSEIMGAYGAQLASAISGDYTKLSDYRKKLAPIATQTGNRAFVELICRAFALGFKDKWTEK